MAEKIVRAKYSFRKQKGFNAISSKRILQFREIYIKREVEEEVFHHEVRTVLMLFRGILLIGILVVGIFVYQKDLLYLEDGYYLIRPEIDEDTRNYDLKVRGIPDRNRLSIEIGAREYNLEEIEKAFDEVYEELIKSALRENDSWDHISLPLDLSGKTMNSKIIADWEFMDGDFITLDGEVLNRNISEEGVVAQLTLLLTYGVHEKRYGIHARIVPESLTEEEKVFRTLEEAIYKSLGGSATEKRVLLPERIDHYQISYEQPYQMDLFLVPLLGAVFVFLNIIRQEQNLTGQQKKRQKQMLMDYSEIVSKLMLFTDSGMTVKKSWEKIVLDYIKSQKNGRKGKRYAYEEMNFTYKMIQNGIQEGRAYDLFAIRCGLRPYIKLGGLLEQNLKRGTKHLKQLLEEEASMAYEERKNQARKLGEEAGTKLLMPMFVMFLIVLVIIVIPAVTGFTSF